MIRAPEDVRVCVFAPTPLLTVTVEEHEDGSERVHLHAGGQGVWVARMAVRLGARAVLCAPLGGETGTVLQTLLGAEDIDVHAVPLMGESGAYVHDRRGGDRRVVVDAPGPVLERHVLDELYSRTLGEGLAAGICVLTGCPTPEIVPDDTYRRIAHDLRETDVTVLADLHGSQLREALEGGLDVLKVSNEELTEDRLLGDDAGTEEVAAAIDELRAGAVDVVVSRAEAGTVALLDGDWFESIPPRLEVADHRGAGDSMTAALAVARGQGLEAEDALRLATAAGCLNVTRHGLATGHRDTIERLAEQVEIRELPDALRRRRRDAPPTPSRG